MAQRMVPVMLLDVFTWLLRLGLIAFLLVAIPCVAYAYWVEMTQAPEPVSDSNYTERKRVRQ